MPQTFVLPRQLALDDDARPLAGAFLYFFQTGTTTPQAVYVDASLTTTHSNPVEALANGQWPKIYLNPAAPVNYRVRITTADGVQLYQEDDIDRGQGGFPISDAEESAGVTPTNFSYPHGDVRRYGAVLDGSTDDTAALTRWASVGGNLTFPVAQTAKITAAIPLLSNSTIQFVAGARVETSTQNISLFSASTKTNIKIRGGHFKQTSAGNDPYTAGVSLLNSSYCEVTDCEFEGMQWAGVFLSSSNQCKVNGNYFHDFLASSAGDKSDIVVYYNSSYNEVRGNRCYGGQDHGIFVQDPGGVGTYLPQHNKVIDNWVGDHNGYGIAVYIGGAQESHNHVHGNTIQNITGSYLSGQSGPGIYCVGNGLGGLQVHNNTVRNCCSATLLSNNAPAGITVTDTATGSIRISVCGNTVEQMPQAPGILISGVLGGATVSNNCVRIPAGNDGSGVGSAALAGNCIKVFNSNNVVVSDNEVLHNGPQDGILVSCTDTDHKNITISGNGIVTQAGSPIRFARDSTFVCTNVNIVGNIGETSSNTPNVLQLTGLDRASVTGNTGGCGTQPAIAVTSCTSTRFSNNIMNCTGANAVSTNGTCTSSFYSRSNSIPGAFSNGGTGFLFEKLLQGSATYDPGSLADGAGATTTVTVTGATTGDFVDAISFSVDLSGITVTGWVSSADTVSVRFQNESGGVLDLASGTLTVRVIKK
jgi:parallel beta-helix repeat protein